MWTRGTLLSLALLVVGGQHARPGDDVDPEPSPVGNLKGEWQQITRVGDGVPSDKDRINNSTIVFDKNKYTLRDRGQVVSEIAFVIDRSKKPAHFDITFIYPDFINNTDKGIVKLQGGVLTLCFGNGGDRPDKFESKQGDGRIIATYKRKAKK